MQLHYPNTFQILLVEDNPADVYLLSESLREAAVPPQLHVTANGEQALEFLCRQGDHANAPRPHLILLDLNLPRKSGHEVLEELKHNALLHNIPVIVLSSSANERDIARAYDLHANCYIQKPSDLDSFLHVVHAIEDFWGRIAQLPPADASIPQNTGRELHQLEENAERIHAQLPESLTYLAP
jgi:CheY-like chemotaxis protein